jgi:hypothetical protein
VRRLISQTVNTFLDNYFTKDRGVHSYDTLERMAKLAMADLNITNTSPLEIVGQHDKERPLLATTISMFSRMAGYTPDGRYSTPNGRIECDIWTPTRLFASANLASGDCEDSSLDAILCYMELYYMHPRHKSKYPFCAALSIIARKSNLYMVDGVCTLDQRLWSIHSFLFVASVTDSHVAPADGTCGLASDCVDQPFFPQGLDHSVYPYRIHPIAKEYHHGFYMRDVAYMKIEPAIQNGVYRISVDARATDGHTCHTPYVFNDIRQTSRINSSEDLKKGDASIADDPPFIALVEPYPSDAKTELEGWKTVPAPVDRGKNQIAMYATIHDPDSSLVRKTMQDMASTAKTAKLEIISDPLLYFLCRGMYCLRMVVAYS